MSWRRPAPPGWPRRSPRHGQHLEPASYVAFAAIVLTRRGRPLRRRPEAAAPARLDQHEIAAREAHADLAADVPRAGRAGGERDAERQPVAATTHVPRRDRKSVV